MVELTSVNAQAAIDAAWFARCQPSDGVVHIFDSGTSIGYGNPVEGGGQRYGGKRGDLFILVTLKPGMRIRFEHATALAVGVRGDLLKSWEPVLHDVDDAPASSAAVQLYSSRASLVNDSPRDKSFRLFITADSDAPDVFTLALPPAHEGNGMTTQPVQAQYRRFEPSDHVRLCGVNGITTRDRPHRKKE